MAIAVLCTLYRAHDLWRHVERRSRPRTTRLGGCSDLGGRSPACAASPERTEDLALSQLLSTKPVGFGKDDEEAYRQPAAVRCRSATPETALIDTSLGEPLA